MHLKIRPGRYALRSKISGQYFVRSISGEAQTSSNRAEAHIFEAPALQNTNWNWRPYWSLVPIAQLSAPRSEISNLKF